MLAIKVKIKGFIVGTIAQVVADVALADQVERGGEKQSHDDAGGVVEAAVREKDAVFGFVDDRVDRVHVNAEDQRQEQNMPPDVQHGRQPGQARKCRHCSAMQALAALGMV